jgi:hypothetical protein
MATVQEALNKLSKLDPNEPILGLIIPFKEFNDDILQGNANNVPNKDVYAKFLKYRIDMDGEMGTTFYEDGPINFLGEWETFLDEEGEEGIYY